MNGTEVLAAALNVTPPWKIVRHEIVNLKATPEFHMEIAADQHHSYPCTECGEERQVRDTAAIRWRPADFFGRPCFVSAEVPKIDCPEHGMVQVVVPWVRRRQKMSIAQLAKARQPPRCKNPCRGSPTPARWGWAARPARVRTAGTIRFPTRNGVMR